MRKTAKALLRVAGTVIICIILLTAVACIPRGLIRRNVQISADYFSERMPFVTLWEDYINSVQDNYSDTVLCDIAYCMDAKHPFSSAIRARYVHSVGQHTYQGLLSAVNEDAEPNLEYGRYWHGSIVFIRPLLMLIPISKIRILCGIMICIMQLVIIALLIKGGNKGFAACYLISFILIHPWILFTSLEHGTAFLVASGASLFMVLMKDRSSDKVMTFFAVTGVVTCFMDFLTNETLSFTLPMLLLIILSSQGDNNAFLGMTVKVQKKSVSSYSGKMKKASKGNSNDRAKENCFMVIRYGLCWLGGYLLMFVIKMALLWVFSGTERFKASIEEGFFRLGGDVQVSNIMETETVDFAKRLSGAVWHNLACLYFTHSGLMTAGRAWLITVAILITGMVIVYLMHERIRTEIVLPMVIIALVPILRFLVLSNHSYVHFFITYRAMMITLAVLLFIIYDNSIRIILVKRSK